MLSSQYCAAVTFLKLQSLLSVFRACKYSSNVSVGACLRVAKRWHAKISFFGLITVSEVFQLMFHNLYSLRCVGKCLAKQN